MRAAALLVMVLLAVRSAFAADIPTDVQVRLQSAMLAHVDSVAVDGAYTYVDASSDEIRTVYPANVHPFVIGAGLDYFVCSEMIDESGDTVTADFLVREIGGNFRVVQMIVNDRESVQAAVKKLKN